ncbi:hypothetical protein AVBRAN12640_09925, partial [Campylobacter sp. RM12640]|nr:hypothetical protein [Campylobacter sp. RM12640]MBZ7990167.1 hypothetical protein [Campylobacter sp. RM12635]
AEIAKAASNFSTAISDITSYYTAKGSFAANLSDMTNVALDTDGKFKIKNKTCAMITAPATGSDVIIYVGADIKDPICQSFDGVGSIAAILGNKKLSTYTDAAKGYKIQ